MSFAYSCFFSFSPCAREEKNTMVAYSAMFRTNSTIFSQVISMSEIAAAVIIVRMR